VLYVLDFVNLPFDGEGDSWLSGTFPPLVPPGRVPQLRGAISPHRICALKPQSSHSRTGFHPNRFEHKSHFEPNPSPLEKKKKSNGPHPVPEDEPSFWEFPIDPRFAPGLIKVKR
jgi:hypothetical protein